jgi:hypothetical protein
MFCVSAAGRKKLNSRVFPPRCRFAGGIYPRSYPEILGSNRVAARAGPWQICSGGRRPTLHSETDTGTRQLAGRRRLGNRPARWPAETSHDAGKDSPRLAETPGRSGEGTRLETSTQGTWSSRQENPSKPAAGRSQLRYHRGTTPDESPTPQRRQCNPARYSTQLALG